MCAQTGRAGRESSSLGIAPEEVFTNTDTNSSETIEKIEKMRVKPIVVRVGNTLLKQRFGKREEKESIASDDQPRVGSYASGEEAEDTVLMSENSPLKPARKLILRKDNREQIQQKLEA